MKNYYVESIIYSISEKIKMLITKNIITEDKEIILYGLDTFSFAMKTILSNLGFKVNGYISDDLEQLITYKRRIKALKARYLNSSNDIINIFTIEEKLIPLDKNILILSGSKKCSVNTIEKLGYQEEKNFFQVFDWKKDCFLDSMIEKRKITLKEIHDIEKNMLYQIDRFCLDKGLRYWVCGGTLLGTVRHQGFIPWDDDVDVFMPWKDYSEFVTEFVPDKNYTLLVPAVTGRKDYFELFLKLVDNRTMAREDACFIRKIHPVAIDIFPLIGLPEKIGERRLFFAQYYELEKKIWEDFYANNGDLSVYDKWYLQQKEFLGKYDFDHTKYVGVLATRYKEKDYTTRKVYDHTLRMPFEDIEVNVPAGYKEYLDNLYGKDWMQLPDESKRVSHHNMEAYWL